MPFVDWTEELSVGVDEIDEEHRNFLGILNALHDAVEANESSEILGSILDQLVEYTRTHFTNEEQILADAGYEQLNEHKLEHYELTKKVLELQHRYRTGPSDVLSRMTVFMLKNWMVDHIEGEDKQYASALAPVS